MRLFLCLLILIIVFSYATKSESLAKFNITIKIPANTTTLRQLPYKSVHVKYTLPNSDIEWTIGKKKNLFHRI
ncbi:unnamed protein product [Rotaria socialis]|uniref:Uncharacterized protein n=1 Tax=Rotaria socialis TaxID=392032 RepID=A0A818ALY0_9BILA|nr:unnamed protein product [Rotaria socialis]CAF4468354.1 unnamed protein product [Rotaria socialis]CAF4842762.1 unnamed protein product [Rotaria socialis]